MPQTACQADRFRSRGASDGISRMTVSQQSAETEAIDAEMLASVQVGVQIIAVSSKEVLMDNQIFPITVLIQMNY